MTKRTKRSVVFGVALAIGMSLIDWMGQESFNMIKFIVGGIIGGYAYWWILKWQGR